MSKSISVRLAEDDYAKLSELADRYQVSNTSVIQRAIGELFASLDTLRVDASDVTVNLKIQPQPEAEPEISPEALAYLEHESNRYATQDALPAPTEAEGLSPYLWNAQPVVETVEAPEVTDIELIPWSFDESTGKTTRKDPVTGQVYTRVEVNVFGG
jgi:hypothetical protein